MRESRQLAKDMELYTAGDDASGDIICATLEALIRRTIRGLLPPHDAETDDVVQDVLIAMLRYLRKARVVPDYPEAFVVTIAKNRCRSLFVWRSRRTARDVDEIAETVPHIAASPLDLIDDAQRRRLLAETVRELDEKCRELLVALSCEGTTIEELRGKLGLESVQAVYYRRKVCIKKAQAFLNRRLFSCQPGGKSGYRPEVALNRSEESGNE